MTKLKRLLVGITVVSLTFAGVTGAGVRIRNTAFGDTEYQVVAGTLAAALVAILLLCYSAVASTKALVLGIWGAGLTLGTATWVAWLLATGASLKDQQDYVIGLTIAAATLAHICVLIGTCGRLKWIVALTILCILGVAGFAGYYLYGPAKRPEWFETAAIVVAGLDGFGTVTALVLAFLRRNTTADDAGESTFTTPLRNRYGRPLDSEPLPALAEPGRTMWDEARSTAKPGGVVEGAMTGSALTTVAAAAAAEAAKPLAWTEAWRASTTDSDEQFSIEAMAVGQGKTLAAEPEPLAEPPLVADEVAPTEPEFVEPEPEAAPEPEAGAAAEAVDEPPAETEPQPSLPPLDQHPTVLLSADIEWRLLESSKKYGISPDEIVLAAIQGIDELDDEDDYQA